jgi:hypothetical protein
MALYATLENKAPGFDGSCRITNGDFTWHVGSPTPWTVTKTTDCWVQADGDELVAIVRQFGNIPMHSGRVVTWRGETARFILENLM